LVSEAAEDHVEEIRRATWSCHLAEAGWQLNLAQPKTLNGRLMEAAEAHDGQAEVRLRPWPWPEAGWQLNMAQPEALNGPTD